MNGILPRALGRIVLAAALLASTAAMAADAQHWVATWGTAPAGPPKPAQLHTFKDQTLRLIVHTSAGGSQLRVRISNEFGAAPLRIGAAHVALREAGAAIVAGSGRPLSFSGNPGITVAPGAPVFSDPVALAVPAMADLAVSLHLPGEAQASTSHGSAFQTSYVSTAGDFSGAAAFPTEKEITWWPFLTQVDVLAAEPTAAIVALGDSITDGAITTKDANRRWPDHLFRRLMEARGHAGGIAALSMVNRGIGGNRLLLDPGAHPMFGRAALARFDRDVLATTGVKYLVVLIGINDIGHPGTDSAPGGAAVNAGELIAAYRQLIARAHAKGITVIGATLTPFEGTVFPNYYSEEKELVRVAVNSWIRSSDEFDGVIDFDAAVRDAARPSRIQARFDSGDHLHPNDAGMQAMANAIKLDMFRGAALVKRPAKAARKR